MQKTERTTMMQHCSIGDNYVDEFLPFSLVMLRDMCVTVLLPAIACQHERF